MTMTTVRFLGELNEPQEPSITNNFLDNGVTDPRDGRFRWNGTTGVRNCKPLSNECLAALRDAAVAKGKPLSDKERAVVLERFK